MVACYMNDIKTVIKTYFNFINILKYDLIFTPLSNHNMFKINYFEYCEMYMQYALNTLSFVINYE